VRFLDLFSGIGGFALAADRVLPEAECVGFSEIDRNAIRIYEEMFPGHPNLGSIVDIRRSPPEADIVFGGFPCQDLSSAKLGREGLKGARSGLFFALVDVILNSQAPDFVIENVGTMRQADRDEIGATLERAFGRTVFLININSKLVSAQQRSRYYWTTFPVRQPDPVGITVTDILEPPGRVPEKMYLSERALAYMSRPYKTREDHWFWATDARDMPKALAVVANFRKGVPYNVVIDLQGRARHWMTVELERLQTFPDGWTEGVAYTARCKALGNAVTVAVIEHILEELT